MSDAYGFSRQDVCFQEAPSQSLFWTGRYRLSLLRLRDRAVPWQFRHFYHRHETTAQFSVMVSISLVLYSALTPVISLVNEALKYATFSPVESVRAGVLLVPGLQTLARRVQLGRGKLLYQEAEPAHELMVLVKGYGRLCVEHDDKRRLTVGLVHPGDLFGEEALLDEPERESSFEAILQSEIDVITREDFTAFIATHPDTLRPITEHLAQRLLIQQRHMILLAFEPVERRLAWLLLELASASGTSNEQEPIIPIYHKDLAAVLGVWRETITATLNHWHSEGLIVQRPGHILLKDIVSVRRMAEESN